MNNKIENIIGKKYTRLTVVSYAFSKNNKRHWMCICECGNTVIADTGKLNSGNTKSCGCLKTDGKHKMTNTRFYNIWSGIKLRCLSPKCNTYHKYGGAGITISDSWLSFNNFKKDMYEEYLEHSKIHGEKQTTIDRIDGKLGYSKENCRWADYSIQTNNTKINNKNTSGYKGISYRKPNSRYSIGGWRSYVVIGNKQHEFGVFKTKREALEVRNKYILENNLNHEIQKYTGE